MEMEGISKETVIVDVEPKNMIIALSKVIHAESLFKEERDRYSKLEKKDNKYFLAFYENQSYHGSPMYEEIQRIELSEEEYHAAEGLKALMNIVVRIE